LLPADRGYSQEALELQRLRADHEQTVLALELGAYPPPPSKSAGQRRDHRGLPVSVDREADEQISHGLERILWELGRRIVDARREIVAVHDLQNAGDQKGFSSQ
jgi:hypothetical protein